jgi:hypothetical protein
VLLEEADNAKGEIELPAAELQAVALPYRLEK